MKTNQIIVAAVVFFLIAGAFYWLREPETNARVKAAEREEAAADARATRIGGVRRELNNLMAEHGNLEVWADCRMEDATRVIYNQSKNRFELHR